jgi:hypothetical protein
LTWIARATQRFGGAQTADARALRASDWLSTEGLSGT